MNKISKIFKGQKLIKTRYEPSLRPKVPTNIEEVCYTSSDTFLDEKQIWI